VKHKKGIDGIKTFSFFNDSDEELNSWIKDNPDKIVIEVALGFWNTTLIYQYKQI
jgi:hypothetical protein